MVRPDQLWPRSFTSWQNFWVPVAWLAHYMQLVFVVIDKSQAGCILYIKGGCVDSLCACCIAYGSSSMLGSIVQAMHWSIVLTSLFVAWLCEGLQTTWLCDNLLFLQVRTLYGSVLLYRMALFYCSRVCG